MIAAWNRYWFAPAPCLDLAVLRIAVCGLQLFWAVFFIGQYADLKQGAAMPESLFDPIAIFRLLNLPFGTGWRPGWEILQLLYVVNIGAGVLAMIGLATNASLVVFAGTSVYLQAFVYSFGDYHHPEAVMMVALGALALSPAGRALSVDRWLRRPRGGGAAGSSEPTSSFAGWPIKLLQWFFVLMYLSAVYSKLMHGGLDWANGYTLQFYLARDGMRHASPLAVWLSQFHLLVLLGQVGVLLFQATFALPVLYPRLRWIYVPAGLALHIMIYLTLTAPFFGWIALYVIFIPWSQALQLARRRMAGAAAG